jgi:1,4-dihydroxy-2-naphthoate octaprenyltransferase
MTRALGRAVLTSSRAPFLALTPVCVLLGCATALGQGASPDAALLGGVLLNALLAHASVNLLNEYLDFKSGIDLHTQRTPFSGGSGGLPAHPEMAGTVLWAGLLCFVLTAAFGLYFVALRGPLLLVPGLMGLSLIAGYTRWINRMPWLCLIAPGLGLGLVMVFGTHLALGGKPSPPVFLSAGILFALGNNLLLLNQYPDISADLAAGRRHFPIAYGIGASNAAYGLFVFAAAAMLVYGTHGAYLPKTALLALVPLSLSLFALRGMLRLRGNIGSLPKYMAANVAAALLTPLALGLAISFG